MSLNKKNKTFIIITSILVCLLLPYIGFKSYFYYLDNKMDIIEVNNDEIYVSNDIEEELTQYTTPDTLEEITNIALFGIDANSGNVGRSDSIMILTLDPTTESIKLASIMRDSYVNIPDYGMDKINHAFSFGDSVLALKTLNYNFELNVDKFMSVNFTNMPTIIDKLGGITINITDEEISHIPGIAASGPQLLDGKQVLAYTRIRYAFGDDFQRTSRHRTVLEAIYNKVKDTNITEVPSLIDKFLPLVQTNIPSSEMIKLGTTFLSFQNKNFIETRFPRDGHWEHKTIDGIYYLGYDLEVAKKQMQEFIYSDNNNN